MRFIVVAAALALGAGVAGLAAAADAGRGQELARNACAMCHVLPDGSGAAVGPALVEVAGEQGPFSAEDVRAVLEQGQHQPARSQVDPAGDAGALADYLNNLR
jgi:cytochrome c2